MKIMKPMTVEELWYQFKKNHPNTQDHYEAYGFGYGKEQEDELSELVVKGIKTATASNYKLYEIENEALPQVGDLNVILNGDKQAVAITEITHVEVCPFDEVTPAHAYLEGEGDRSLGYWRDVHKAFFERDLEDIGKSFDEKMPVVCERFIRVF